MGNAAFYAEQHPYIFTAKGKPDLGFRSNSDGKEVIGIVQARKQLAELRSKPFLAESSKARMALLERGVAFFENYVATR